MEVEKVEEGDDVLKLRIGGINEAVANSLRRAMSKKVETLAVSQLHISNNESGLYDEMIANRVGQIPLTIPDNVDEDDTVHVALKQEGPGTVLAEDLKADNDEAEPVNPEAVIVKLKEDQRIEFEAEAELGTGQEHAKHQGGTIGYEQEDDDTFLFRIESTSGYSNEELLEEGMEVLQEELDEFQEEAESL